MVNADQVQAVNGTNMLRAVLIDPGGGWHQELGHCPTDDPDLLSIFNQGRVIALVRAWRQLTGPGQHLLITLGATSVLRRLDYLTTS